MKIITNILLLIFLTGATGYSQIDSPAPNSAISVTVQDSLTDKTATFSEAVDTPLSLAALENKIEENRKRTNRLWLIIAAALVFMMQPGFMLLELGFSRSKNALNIVMKNLVDFCVATLSFMLIGFGLMFAGGSSWIGMQFPSLLGYAGSDDFWAFWLFQSTFVGAAATIASGAMAERTKFSGYLTYTIILSAIIYPVLGHWSWASLASDFSADFGGTLGILETYGFHDFAGSTVVHGVGGACALAGVIVLGPRLGRFDGNGKPVMMPGHNLPLASLGVLLFIMVRLDRI